MQGQKRWRLSFVAAAAVLTGAAPGVTLMDATADEGHFYKVESGSYCMDNFGRTGLGYLFLCGDQTNQHWTWGGVTNTWVVSRERVHGQAKCLGTPGTEEGAPVGVHNCSSPINLVWDWVPYQPIPGTWLLYQRLPNGRGRCVGSHNNHLELSGVCVVWRHRPQAIPGPYVNWP